MGTHTYLHYTAGTHTYTAMSSLSYTISGDKEEGRDTKQQCSNLQEAFLQFRKKKQVHKNPC